MLPLGHTTLRVIDLRQADPDESPVLVFEDTSDERLGGVGDRSDET